MQDERQSDKLAKIVLSNARFARQLIIFPLAIFSIPHKDLYVKMNIITWRDNNMNSPLATWRKALGFTQPQLADVARVSQGHISQVENGHAILGEKLKAFLEKIGGDALSGAADLLQRDGRGERRP